MKKIDPERAPCYQCPDRNPLCRLTCGRWEKARELRARDQEQERKARGAELEAANYRRAAAARAKLRKKHR